MRLESTSYTESDFKGVDVGAGSLKVEDVGDAELGFGLDEPSLCKLVAEGECDAGMDVAHGEARFASGGVGVHLASV